MNFASQAGRVVAIVTGGSSQIGREVAGGLARRTWPVVIVYLDHQARTEATVTEIIAAGGTAIAVRADLADDLDVQRLFTESAAEFGHVDVVVHTTDDSVVLLCRYAARHVRPRGVIVITRAPGPIAPQTAARLRERGVTVERMAPHAVPGFFDGWRRHNGD